MQVVAAHQNEPGHGSTSLVRVVAPCYGTICLVLFTVVIVSGPVPSRCFTSNQQYLTWYLVGGQQYEACYGTTKSNSHVPTSRCVTAL